MFDPASNVSSLSNDQVKAYITGCVMALQVLPKDNKNYYQYSKHKLLYQQGKLLNPLSQVLKLTEIPGIITTPRLSYKKVKFHLLLNMRLIPQNNLISKNIENEVILPVEIITLLDDMSSKELTTIGKLS